MFKPVPSKERALNHYNRPGGFCGKKMNERSIVKIPSLIIIFAKAECKCKLTAYEKMCIRQTGKIRTQTKYSNLHCACALRASNSSVFRKRHCEGMRTSMNQRERLMASNNNNTS